MIGNFCVGIHEIGQHFSRLVDICPFSVFFDRGETVFKADRAFERSVEEDFAVGSSVSENAAVRCLRGIISAVFSVRIKRDFFKRQRAVGRSVFRRRLVPDGNDQYFFVEISIKTVIIGVRGRFRFGLNGISVGKDQHFFSFGIGKHRAARTAEKIVVFRFRQNLALAVDKPLFPVLGKDIRVVLEIFDIVV